MVEEKRSELRELKESYLEPLEKLFDKVCLDLRVQIINSPDFKIRKVMKLITLDILLDPDTLELSVSIGNGRSIVAVKDFFLSPERLLCYNLIDDKSLVEEIDRMTLEVWERFIDICTTKPYPISYLPKLQSIIYKREISYGSFYEEKGKILEMIPTPKSKEERYLLIDYLDWSGTDRNFANNTSIDRSSVSGFIDLLKKL